MRIAINTLSENPYAPSGAFGYYQNLLTELHNLVDEDELLIFVSKASEKYFGPYSNKNVKTVVLPFSNERRVLRILIEHLVFPFLIWTYRIQVLNTGTAILFCPCKLVATMKTMHAFTNAAALTPATRIYRRFMYRWTARKADAIISNSTSQTQDLKRFLNYEESKIKLVYEAIDHETFKPANSAELRRNKKYLKKFGVVSPFILFVSSLYQYKNAETLLEAFAGIEKRYYLLVIVGYPREKAYFEQLKHLVDKLKLNEKVIFTGGVPHEETAIFYQSAELFVYPSKYETFGLTVLEAMACGCPVITSNVSSMPEIAVDAAWFFDPQSPAELAFSIQKVLGKSRLRKELIDKGLKRAKEFTWRKTAEKTLESFRFAFSNNHK